MKKIKLDSGKLTLKKEVIGDLLNKEKMKLFIGGDGYGYAPTTPVPTCQCATVGCASQPPQCQTPNLSQNCPASANCTNNTFCSNYTCGSPQTCSDVCTVPGALGC